MRLHIRTTRNKEVVHFNYQQKLVGVLHKWLGRNELHGTPALYSFSWLMNAKPIDGGLDFAQGAKLFISFHDEGYLKQVVQSILKDPLMCYGMEVVDVSIEDNPDFSNRNKFLCGSPIFIRRFNKDKDRHYTFEDENAGELLKETLLHKMDQAGLEVDETLDIRFDRSANARTKIIEYRNVKNRVNLCPVIIDAKPETKLFAWNVGLGNSTGIGFGSIY